MEKDKIYNMLRDFDLEEILEMNDISDEEVLEALFEQGYEFKETPEPL